MSRLEARDAELAPALRDIAFRHRSYAYRFAWALLRREGRIVNRKRVRRIWRALGLTWVHRKKSSKIRTGASRVFAPTGPNQVWAYDFIHDRCGNGQSLKILTVIDEWTRESLAIEVASSIGAARVIDAFESLVETYGAPQTSGDAANSASLGHCRNDATSSLKAALFSSIRKMLMQRRQSENQD